VLTNGQAAATCSGVKFTINTTVESIFIRPPSRTRNTLEPTVAYWELFSKHNRRYANNDNIIIKKMFTFFRCIANRVPKKLGSYNDEIKVEKLLNSRFPMFRKNIRNISRVLIRFTRNNYSILFFCYSRVPIN